jgi:hypothetical protein
MMKDGAHRYFGTVTHGTDARTLAAGYAYVHWDGGVTRKDPVSWLTDLGTRGVKAKRRLSRSRKNIRARAMRAARRHGY